MSEHIYDLIIVGAGAAGMTAGLYAGRAMLDTLILERSTIGGMAHSTEEIVNYPGIPVTSGPKLMDTLRQQAQDFGCQFKSATVTDLDLEGDVKRIHCGSTTYQAYAVILATGTEHRKLGFDGEAEFTGRGVAYCATCDGELFKDRDIVVIGGGFQAAEESIYLTRFARSVNIVMITDDFTCAKGTAEATKKHPKISIRYSTAVERLEGKNGIEAIHLKHLDTGETETLRSEDGKTMGLFVFAGLVPLTGFLKNKVALDQQGYITTDENLLTNIPGVWAAGDNRPKALRQLVTSVSDGAIAADQAGIYVAELRDRLGLPEIGAERAKTQAQQAKPDATKESPAQSASNSSQSQHFITPDLAKQLTDLFSRMQRDILVKIFTAPDAKGDEMRVFMQEVADCGAKIHLEFLSDQDEQVANYQVERFPAAVLCDLEGNDLRIRFSGIPGGHELTSLALALYRAATNSGLEESQISAITQKVQSPLKLQAAISLSCHLCPTLVTNTIQMALATEQIRMEMIDTGLYPEFKDRYEIMSVPSLIVNDGQAQSFGPKTIDEILALI